MRVNCREQIANPAEPVNGQDERANSPPLTVPPVFAVRQSRGRQHKTLPPSATIQKGGFSMTEHEKYQEHIRHTHDALCKIVIRHAAIDAARSIRSRRRREISLEYLIDEKHYPFSTADEYLAEPTVGDCHAFSPAGKPSCWKVRTLQPPCPLYQNWSRRSFSCTSLSV